MRGCNSLTLKIWNPFFFGEFILKKKDYIDKERIKWKRLYKRCDDVHCVGFFSSDIPLVMTKFSIPFFSSCPTLAERFGGTDLG